MAQTSMVQTLGDSLRDLAGVVDSHPHLTLGLAHPENPFVVAFQLATAEFVASFAAAVGAEAHTHVAADGKLHTSADLSIGNAEIHAFAITTPAPRELHRPLGAVAPHEVIEP